MRSPIRKLLCGFCLFAGFATWSLSVNAAVYSRQDKLGNVYITDNPAAGNDYRIVQTSVKRPAGFLKIVTTGGEYSSLIKKAAYKTGLDDSLIRAVIRVESDFNPRAVSSKGAKGLMQLMPALARYYGVQDVFDPAANIMAGSSYLQTLKERFGGFDEMLAAYNAGPSRVEKYGGVPPFAETQKYVDRVKWYCQYYSRQPDLITFKGVGKLFEQACQAFNDNDFRRSASLFGKVLKRYPTSAEANYNLALVEDRFGRTDLAVEHYNQALRCNPYFTESCYNLAILYERLNRINAAIAAWQRSLRCEISPVKRLQIKVFVQELQELQNQQ